MHLTQHHNLPLSVSNPYRDTPEHINHYDSPGKDIGIGRPNLLTLYIQAGSRQGVAKEERARKAQRATADHKKQPASSHQPPRNNAHGLDLDLGVRTPEPLDDLADKDEHALTLNKVNESVADQKPTVFADTPPQSESITETTGPPSTPPHKLSSYYLPPSFSKLNKQLETWIYTLLPLGLGGEERRPGVTHRLIYFAYGIFHGPPNKEHWTLRAELDLKLPQYEINVWSYPQVPERSASTTIPHLENAYRMLARTAKGKRIQITFMGESGGNIALVLVICAVSEVWRGQSEGEDSPPKREKYPKTTMPLTKDPFAESESNRGSVLGGMGEWSSSDPKVAYPA
ncbi:hypothetical protein NA56DRAFT_703510 [Hyaloscypha hepaticicola]|uniref:Alpha/beta-hydrolase n=1 Tax=Hyaloscypha hepaticicola TaxID=2082293 RepID=A0A2J6Q577_9HELO|nr:hypothetical protein NA56DRAFT_703510 [Hyaloscypha hepaticicola]